VRSTVRTLIDPGAPTPAYSGLATTGGYVEGVPVDTDPGTYEMIFGKRAFFGYALAPDRSVWWFANVPRSAEPARDPIHAADDDLRGQLTGLFDGDHGPAIKLIEATEHLMPLSSIHTLTRLPRWHRGRSVVIGDAAHAPSPTSGQGARCRSRTPWCQAHRRQPGHGPPVRLPRGLGHSSPTAASLTATITMWSG
jgi:FAD-dependent urate hydroxylase